MKKVFNSVDRVEQLAVSHNMSVSHLAIDSGINPSTIATAKSRGCQLNLDTIIRICDHLDMPLTEFFREPDCTEVIYSLFPTSTATQMDGRKYHDTGSRI